MQVQYGDIKDDNNESTFHQLGLLNKIRCA